jgi:hypothetical protein
MGINGLTMVVTMLSVILTGAAVIREREHGTLEHLLVMPLRPIEIMLGKIGANSLVVLMATALSTGIVIRGLLGAPLHGSPLLFLAGGAVVTLPVALGRGLAGPKESQGDQRTPEGDYRVVGEARSSRFHRFVLIDYPSPLDADRGLADARITAADHARIVDAHERGAVPPFDTPLGGDIRFHGEGRRWEGESQALDWTFGCIALSDADLDFLLARMPAGTPVTILGVDAPLPGDLPEP